MPDKKVIVTIIDVHPAVKLLKSNIYESKEYIKIIKDINIEINPIPPIILSGLFEKLIIPISC